MIGALRHPCVEIRAAQLCVRAAHQGEPVGGLLPEPVFR
jgi:hypothetical protein